MAKLKLLSLHCIKTDDSGETENIFDTGTEDEPMLRVNHETIWSGRMSAGSKKDLSELTEISFNNNLMIELWERDPGYDLGQDDPLGKLTVHSSQAGSGKVTHQFRTKNAKYDLLYQVK